mgnify:CR=1 FL=1
MTRKEELERAAKKREEERLYWEKKKADEQARELAKEYEKAQNALKKK